MQQCMRKSNVSPGGKHTAPARAWMGFSNTCTSPPEPRARWLQQWELRQGNTRKGTQAPEMGRPSSPGAWSSSFGCSLSTWQIIYTSVHHHNLNDCDHQRLQLQFSLESVTFALLSFQGFIHFIGPYVILKSTPRCAACLRWYREHGKNPGGCQCPVSCKIVPDSERGVFLTGFTSLGSSGNSERKHVRINCSLDPSSKNNSRYHSGKHTL